MKKDSIAGLQLAGRFALPPNSLGYCGKDSAPEKFKKCIIGGECSGVEDELEKFIVFHPYLKTLSEITGLPKYSEEIVEAYCIGNDLLKKVKMKDYDRLLDNFLLQGVPEWLVTELRKDKPKKFIPTHLFQVLHVGVGRASGSVPFNIETINNCMFRWGRVTKIGDGEVVVKLSSLRKIKEGFKLYLSTETHKHNADLVPDIKINDVIAVHWGQVIKKLNKEELIKLKFWTNAVLEVIK